MLVLIVKGDPKGYEEKEALDREVGCLEPFLESLPTVCVLCYLKHSNPEFLNQLGGSSFYRQANCQMFLKRKNHLICRPFFQTCFTMALFLKSGPCFILPASGLFGRILDSIEYICFLQSVLQVVPLVRSLNIFVSTVSAKTLKSPSLRWDP